MCKIVSHKLTITVTFISSTSTSSVTCIFVTYRIHGYVTMYIKIPSPSLPLRFSLRLPTPQLPPLPPLKPRSLPLPLLPPFLPPPTHKFITIHSSLVITLLSVSLLTSFSCIITNSTTSFST